MDTNEELQMIESLNLIELYEKLQTLSYELLGIIPDDINETLQEAKLGINLPIHVGILHEEVGFIHKEKNGVVIYRGQSISYEALMDEINDRKVLLKQELRSLLQNDDEAVRGMTLEDENKHLGKG